jgi:hypothetical protein
VLDAGPAETVQMVREPSALNFSEPGELVAVVSAQKLEIR